MKLPGDDGSASFLMANPIQGPSRNPLQCGHGQPVHFTNGKWRHLASKQPCKFVTVVRHYI